MKADAIKCKKCKDIIYSRSIHDYRECTCKSIAIDGGFDYTKLCFIGKKPKIFQIEVNATKRELYNDWNHINNKFGLIKDEDDKIIQLNDKKFSFFKRLFKRNV